MINSFIVLAVILIVSFGVGTWSLATIPAGSSSTTVREAHLTAGIVAYVIAGLILGGLAWVGRRGLS